MPVRPSRHKFKYRGIWFKSRLEARWAEFFSRLGWKWEYEPHADFREGSDEQHGWLPDFALVPRGESGPERIYVEVKPGRIDRSDVQVQVEDAGCTDPVLIVSDVLDGFHVDVNRYVLGWHLHRGRFSRAVVTLCSTRGRHLCNPATDRPHHLCGNVDEDVHRTGDVTQTLDRYWVEAGNQVGVGSPARRTSEAQPSVAPDHCRTLEVIPAPQSAEAAGPADSPPRSGISRRWLAVGGGALAAGVAVALALAFALGSDGGEPEAVAPFEDRDCADFASWAEAQALYEEAGGPTTDPHSLDPDKDGVACERLREAEERAGEPDSPAATEAPGGDRDCADFDSWAEAQAFYEESGGPASDPHSLDPDGDGIACESLR